MVGECAGDKVADARRGRIEKLVNLNRKLTGQFRKVATLDDGPAAGLLEAIGMPLTLIPILAAIWPAIDPIHTLMNNTSDLVGTMLIARQLDKVDMNVYNS